MMLDDLSDDFPGSPQRGKKFDFPALRHLSLSSISFDNAEKESVSSYNFYSLRSLRLCFCPGWGKFLEHATTSSASSQQKVHLKSLEIQFGSDYNNSFGEVQIITTFLGSFEGLEELFISTGESRDTLDVWYSLARHKHTLRILVHHQRIDSLPSDDLRDSGDLSLEPEDIERFRKDPALINPFSDLNLEFIGISCDLENLVQYPVSKF